MLNARAIEIAADGITKYMTARMGINPSVTVAIMASTVAIRLNTKIDCTFVLLFLLIINTSPHSPNQKPNIVIISLFLPLSKTHNRLFLYLWLTVRHKTLRHHKSINYNG
jgi:hypothetical protein